MFNDTKTTQDCIFNLKKKSKTYQVLEEKFQGLP